MIRPICKDVLFLSQRSVPATKEDLPIAADLMDTLRANRDGCVGMAANMIGIRKNIIIVNMGLLDVVMFNPVITKKSGPYDTEEGCLSLMGQRPCRRYETITVRYQDMNWKTQVKEFTGWTAEIIQHEVDHLSGIII